jgi:hypothetical protein
MINPKMSTHCSFKKTFSPLANQECPSHLLPTIDESLRPPLHDMTFPNRSIVRLEFDIHVNMLDPAAWPHAPALINFIGWRSLRNLPVDFAIDIRPVLYASHQTSQMYEVEMRWWVCPF